MAEPSQSEIDEFRDAIESTDSPHPRGTHLPVHRCRCNWCRAARRMATKAGRRKLR